MQVSRIVCTLGWCSSFVLAWAWLFDAVRVSLLSVLLFVFFVVVGVIAGVMTRDDLVKKK